MLRNRNSQSIKLIDFGLAQRIQGKEDIRALMGTAEFVGEFIPPYVEMVVNADSRLCLGSAVLVTLSGITKKKKLE